MRTVSLVLVTALAAASSGAMAQIVGINGGPAGQAQAALQPGNLLPDIRIDRQGSVGDDSPQGPARTVTALHVTGATRFSEATLVQVAGFRPGQSYSVADLRHMAGLISSFYNAHGYLVAQAYVPQQPLGGGALTIAVVEGRWEAVKLDNGSRLRSGLARETLSGLDGGQVVYSPPLERRLLMLSDVPGVTVTSTVAPGAQVGTSDLNVAVTNGHLFSGEFDVDNDGDPYTGRWRGGGTLNINDPLGLGDRASVRVLTSGSGFDYVRGAYQVQAALATVGVAYTDFRYSLGPQYVGSAPYAGSDGKGSERIASVYASYPLVRSRENSLRLLADVDYRWLNNNLSIPGDDFARRAWAGSTGVAGTHQDGFGGGGTDVYSMSVTVGDLDIRTSLAREFDHLTAQSQGTYVVVRGSLDRLQTIAGPFQLYAWVRGQWASKNLDISEKMELGGAYGVRAYPEGEAYGDEGYVATAELRAWLTKPSASFPGRFQLAVFEDVGHVRYAANPWLAGSDSATRAGVGGSLAWTQEGDFLVRVSYAHRTWTPPATSYPQSAGVVRFEAVKFF